MRTANQTPDPPPRLLSRERVEAAADTLRRAKRVFRGKANEGNRVDLLMMRDVLDWVMGEPSVLADLLRELERDLRRNRRRRGR